jgi:hypothetical protein
MERERLGCRHMAEVGRHLPWQERRANLLVEGLDLPQRGRRSAHRRRWLLEVTGECDPCSRMEELARAQGGVAARLARRRVAKVSSGGEIAVGDNQDRRMTKRFQDARRHGRCAGKRVLVREDLNVPMADGAVTDDTRLRARCRPSPSFRTRARSSDPRPFRPPQGQRNPEMSLALVTKPFEQVLGRPVRFIDDCRWRRSCRRHRHAQGRRYRGARKHRFHAGEEKNDPALVAAMAKLGDLYVNDAFSAAHRAHASTEGLAHALPAMPAADGGRTRRARQGARQSRASGRGGGRRRQGVDQARRAPAPGRPRSIT